MLKNSLIAILILFISSLATLLVVRFFGPDSYSLPLLPELPIPGLAGQIEKPDRQTILLLGVGGENHEGGNLTDTIMIAQINNLTGKIYLISIPRDLLVFDEQGYYRKINAIYAEAISRGLSQAEAVAALQTKLTEITGLNFDYYAQVDFNGFVQLVDALEGIEVEVSQAIDDPYYPGPNYSYQRFQLPAGKQILDGETALKYSRSRYTSLKGDLDRAKRQQQILKSVKEKVFNLNPVLEVNKILTIISIAQKSLQTDIPMTELRTFYESYKDSQDYEFVSLVIGENLLNGNLKEGYRQFGYQRGYVLEPRLGEKNYLEIQEQIAYIDQPELYQQTLDQLKSLNPSIGVIWSSSLDDDTKNNIQKLLTQRGFKLQDYSNRLEIQPALGQENILYLTDNPYSESDAMASNNPGLDYLERTFAPIKQVSKMVETELPILYIQQPLSFKK